MESATRPLTREASLENQHETVYGAAFSRYDAASMTEFVNFLRERFRTNGIDPSVEFFGKRCLDAGCGNGRGALFMAEHGAASIDCVDISPSNVGSTRFHLSSRGHPPTGVIQGSIERLPFPDDHFDFVWCNGVLMHTANPDACLEELSRVLKVGGRCWIYVYGADGIAWYWVSRARKIFSRFTAEQCLTALQLMRLEARYVAEYVDDWTVPYLRTYAAEPFSRRLSEAGFSDVEPLRFGVGYDTSHRRNLYPEDVCWMGEGDLRFLLTKTDARRETSQVLDREPNAMGKPFSQAVTDRFRSVFDAYEDAVDGNLLLAVMTSANIQRTLRDMLTREGPFPVDAFHEAATEIVGYARALG